MEFEEWYKKTYKDETNTLFFYHEVKRAWCAGQKEMLDVCVENNDKILEGIINRIQKL